ncbi:MAG: hypothetical protein DMG05_11435 [Acidobacteria bacterium]|nr:MAG: hypothetical protein DMG05_11435 [Acidobacteriota bacterium]
MQLRMMSCLPRKSPQCQDPQSRLAKKIKRQKRAVPTLELALEIDDLYPGSEKATKRKPILWFNRFFLIELSILIISLHSQRALGDHLPNKANLNGSNKKSLDILVRLRLFIYCLYRLTRVNAQCFQ